MVKVGTKGRGKRKLEPTAGATRPKPPVLAIKGLEFNPPKPDAEPSLFPDIPDLRKRRYLEALTRTPSKGKAARDAGIDLKTGYNWRHDETDVEFQTALRVALELGLHRAEDEGWERAIDGWEEPVYQAGRLVGTKLVKSDTMLIFMMKGNLPEKYRERFEHSGPNGGPLQATVITYRIPDNGRDEISIG